MMKNLTLSLVAASLFSANLSQAQLRNCATSAPSLQYENWVQSLYPSSGPGKGGSSNNSTQAIFNIPVIVHVIHNNEPINSNTANTGNNISTAQILDQINILNADFNGTNPDTTLIPAVFKPLLGKFQVNFCMAVVNPTGGVLATPGIDRINRVSKGWNAFPYTMAYVDGTVKPNSIWDPNRYFNLWVVPLSGGTLGYATFPMPGASGLGGLTSNFGTPTTDGVVIPGAYFGSIGTASLTIYNKGRTATHEVGHWIGLRHIWGDGTCATDFCNDTPPAQNANGPCHTHPYKLGTCGGNTTGEMFMNYMDYTRDNCMYMFTMDQKNRAQLVMTHSPMRVTLLTSTVCNLPTTTNDLAILNVISPTYSQVINCANSITPQIRVSNLGSNLISSAVYNYSVNGMPLQTFNWTGNLAPGATQTITLPAITNIPSGNKAFSVTATAPNGGVDNNLTNNNNMQNFSIINSFTMNASSATICAGSPATLTASGGATTYSWNPGAITGTQVVFSPASTTIYTLTGSTGTCSNTRTTTIVVSGSLSINVNTASICAGSSATLTASGATTYTWNTGSNLSSIVVNPTSTTQYTVSGNNGSCSGNKTTTVVVSITPTVTVNSQTICNGSNATLTAVGATNYSWNTGATSSVINPNPTSTTVYTVIGTNGTCSNTKTSTVTVNASPTVNVNSASICSGGSVTLTATGATTYLWNTGATASSIVVSPVSTTNYTVTGTNVSCSNTKTTSVIVNTTPTVSVNNATICNGNTANLSASGATTYTWNTGATTNAINPNPTSTTIYTVSGFNGICVNTRTAIVVVNANPTITANSATICSGNNANITAAGATTYTWNTGANTSAINVSPIATTIYTVNGTSANGCVGTRTTIVNVNATPTVAVNNVTICNGGTATLTASGAATYVWNTGATSANIAVTPTVNTTYTVIGTSNGCTNTKTVSVAIGSALSINIAASNTAICNGNSVNLTASGATTYTWNTGANVSGISVSPTSNTTYTVNGTSGACGGSKTISIVVNSNPSATTTQTNVTCNGLANGALNVSPSGNGPFTINYLPSGPSNLVAGTYSVIVTSVNGCSFNTSATITQPAVLSANVNANNTSCNTSCNGSASAIVTGGTAGYNYTVLPTGGNAANAANLCAGSYTYLVKDANGCNTSAVFSIANGTTGLNIAASSTLASCATCTNGVITATSNGTGPFTYVWTPGNFTTQTVYDVAVGCYTVTITDNSGCSGTNTTCVNYSTSTGLLSASLDASQVLVYPNPNNGVFNVLSNVQLNKYQLFDVTGRIISENKLTAGVKEVNLTTLASGIYYIKVFGEQGSVSKKIVKE